MSQDLYQATYERLPIALQNLVCSAYGLKETRLRIGSQFERRMAALLDSERWSRADADAFQDAKVAEAVANAYEHTSYYRQLMTERGLTPSDVRSRADLVKLPILTKETVRAEAGRMLSDRAVRRRLVPRHTSGTTGTSLEFFVSRSFLAVQWAIWWRHRARFGFRPGDWHVNFTGKLVVPPQQDRPPYWRWSRPMRQLVVNMQHTTPEQAPAIAAFLDERAFPFWIGYPSIIHAFATSVAEAGITLRHPPGVVFTGAENVLDVQRRDIEALTGAIVTDQYGLSEGCGNASHCPELLYHEDFEFGVLECLDPVEQADGAVRGTIVCTGFANPDFPFIRYDTGDVGIWTAEGSRCACGRESRSLVAIEGRIDDYVVTPEGRHIMRFDYVFKETSNIKKSQIVQKRAGELTVRIVRRPSYSSADERFVAAQIAHWVSPKLRVDFDYVDDIEPEANGKFRAVKSLLSAPVDEAPQQ